MTRIALIHAVSVAIPPVTDAFARLWPEADCMNLLDDRLSVDRAADGELTAAMSARIMTLGTYARDHGAAAILFTCSAFGPAIETVSDALPIPVLKPNEAMFNAALDMGGRIGLLASFAPSLPSMRDEYQALATRRGQDVGLHTDCAPDAMGALQSGDGAHHDALLAQKAAAFAGCDVIMLAQFSTARAAPLVAARTGKPVLTSPDSAVRALRDATT